MPIINKIVSTFGDHTSLVPMLFKDAVNSTGMTAFAYDNGGKKEGKDKFIDEFGTMAIWIGGIPFFKGVVDKTLYKAAKLDPKADIRLIADKDQLSIAQKYAEKLSDKSFSKSLTDAAKNKQFTKNMFYSRFVISTALTLGAFFALVQFRQNYTKKQVEKEFWANKAKEKAFKENIANSMAFKGFLPENQNSSKSSMSLNKTNNNKKHLSFGSVTTALQGFMFDPVRNMLITEVGITGQRLGTARPGTEFAEYGIKEGGFLLFMYAIGRYVQSGMEKLSEKYFKRPIELHAQAIAAPELKEAMKSGKLLKDVEEFKAISGTNKGIYEFVYSDKNAGNTVIQAAKNSEIIKVVKDNPDVINPKQYINPETMKKLSNNLEKLSKSAVESGLSLDEFLKSTAKFKTGSVAANIGVSCLFLGVGIPLAMREYRKKKNGNKEFQVENDIRERLENNFKAQQTNIKA